MIGYYKLPKISAYAGNANKFTFRKAQFKSVIDVDPKEYENEYKHKMSDFSSFDLK